MLLKHWFLWEFSISWNNIKCGICRQFVFGFPGIRYRYNKKLVEIPVKAHILSNLRYFSSEVWRSVQAYQGFAGRQRFKTAPAGGSFAMQSEIIQRLWDRKDADTSGYPDRAFQILWYKRGLSAGSDQWKETIPEKWDYIKRSRKGGRFFAPVKNLQTKTWYTEAGFCRKRISVR